MPAKKHNFARTEIAAGAMVLVSAAALFGFIVVMAGLGEQAEFHVYHANFTNLIGLEAGADVRFGGLKAGRVAAIEPHPEDQSLLRVTAEVDQTFPLNEGCVASIESLSLTSPKHMEISTGDAEADRVEPGGVIRVVNKGYGFVDLPDLTGVLDGGETLLGDLRALLGVKEARQRAAEDGAEFTSVVRIAEDVRDLIGVEAAKAEAQAMGMEFASVARIAGDVRGLIGMAEAQAKAAEEGGTVPSMAAITGNVNDLITQYEPNIESILIKVETIQDGAADLLRELNGVLGDNRESIDAIVTDLAGVLDSVRGELDSLMASLQETLDNAGDAAGSVAEVLDRRRPEIEDMVRELSAASRNLNAFTKTLKDHPEVVIRGKKPEGRR